MLRFVVFRCLARGDAIFANLQQPFIPEPRFRFAPFPHAFSRYHHQPNAKKFLLQSQAPSKNLKGHDATREKQYLGAWSGGEVGWRCVAVVVRAK
jgi:hypothetical protein